jgi:hypothetical protein
MDVNVDIWLRGQDFATTRAIAGVPREPRAWTDDDVRMVLEGMLKAMHMLKHPGEGEPEVSLRGLSWIVSPYEEGGVVIAIEIGLGAAISGPFDIDQATLETAISRVMQRPLPPPVISERVH